MDTVFHTATLTDPLASWEAMWAVIVGGTSRVIDASLACGVRNLVHTSTTAVIFNGRDIRGLSEEQCPYPRRHLDAYSRCKAEAERLVVAASGRVSPLSGEALCALALRPHAIFGPRDTHFISSLISRARSGDITHTIGSGRNLVDFTYVGNVIHAMILAMTRMSRPVSPLAPAAAQKLDAEQLAARAQLGGQCFFITNGEPRSFWEFISLILNETGCVGPTKSISFCIAYVIAWAMEWVRWVWSATAWLHGRPPMAAGLTRRTVCVMGCTQYFSIEKARRLLGYEPVCSIDQGLETTINYFFRRRNISLWAPAAANLAVTAAAGGSGTNAAAASSAAAAAAGSHGHVTAHASSSHDHQQHHAAAPQHHHPHHMAHHPHVAHHAHGHHQQPHPHHHNSGGSNGHSSHNQHARLIPRTNSLPTDADMTAAAAAAAAQGGGTAARQRAGQVLLAPPSQGFYAQPHGPELGSGGSGGSGSGSGRGGGLGASGSAPQLLAPLSSGQRSGGASPALLSQWPHRHYSTSPPLEDHTPMGMAPYTHSHAQAHAQAQLAHQYAQMALQQQFANMAAAAAAQQQHQQQQHPQQHSSPPFANLIPSYSFGSLPPAQAAQGFAPPQSHPQEQEPQADSPQADQNQLLAPQPQRMQQLPSSCFLNAYSKPPPLAEGVPPITALQSIVLSPPLAAQSSEQQLQQ